MLVDGLPINSLSLSGAPLQYLSLSDVERIEIVRGAASAIYGADAIGGVINVITRRGAPGLTTDGMAGYGSEATRQVEAGVSGGDAHWRFRLHANHFATDGFSVRRDASGRDADDDAFRNTGGGIALSYLPAAGHEMGMTYQTQQGRVQYDSFSGNGDFDNRARFELAQGQLFTRNRLSERWMSTLTYGEATEKRRDWNEPSEWDGSDGRTRRNSLNQYWSWQHDVRLPLGSGLLVAERFEQSARPRALFMRGNTRTDALGLGWVAAWGPHSWQMNARYDDHSRYGGKTTGAVAYGYQFAPAWRVSGALSKAFKAPSLDQLYNAQYGNPDLKSEDAVNREASLIWEQGGQRASMTYYLNRLSNLIAWEADGYGNVDRARIEGVTLTYAIRREAWEAAGSVDFLDARDERTDKRLGRRARESLALTALRRFGRWEVGGEWQAAGRRYDTNVETLPMGGYGVVNLTTAYRLTPEWSLEARVDNIFDRDYETAKGYATQGAGVFLSVRYRPVRFGQSGGV